MLRTGKDDADDTLVTIGSIRLRPRHNVHHRLVFILVDGEGTIHLLEQHLVGMWGAGNDDNARTEIVAKTEHTRAVCHHIHLHSLQIFLFADRPDAREVGLVEFVPIALQRHHTTTASLEMHMIGRAGTTLRTIVEDKHLLQLRGDLHHVLIVVENLLFAMMTQRNGEVLGENRVRIQQQVILFQQRTADLFRRAIHFAEETGALLDALCIHFRTSRNNAGRVVLSH